MINRREMIAAAVGLAVGLPAGTPDHGGVPRGWQGKGLSGAWAVLIDGKWRNVHWMGSDGLVCIAYRGGEPELAWRDRTGPWQWLEGAMGHA